MGPGDTRDPRELIPGNPQALQDTEHGYTKLVASFTDSATRLRRLRVGVWDGPGADAFYATTEALTRRLHRMADDAKSIGTQLRRSSQALAWGQSQAREAISHWPTQTAASPGTGDVEDSEFVDDVAEDEGASEAGDDAAAAARHAQARADQEYAQEILSAARTHLQDSFRNADRTIQATLGDTPTPRGAPRPDTDPLAEASGPRLARTVSDTAPSASWRTHLSSPIHHASGIPAADHTVAPADPTPAPSAAANTPTQPTAADASAPTAGTLADAAPADEIAADPAGPEVDPAWLAGLPVGDPRRRQHVVVGYPHHGQHDNLYDIAQRHLGDGNRWHDLLALNHDLPQPDGRHLHGTGSFVRPGWVIALPDTPAPHHPPPQPPAPGAPPDSSAAHPDPTGAAPPTDAGHSSSMLPTALEIAGLAAGGAAIAAAAKTTRPAPHGAGDTTGASPSGSSPAPAQRQRPAELGPFAQPRDMAPPPPASTPSPTTNPPNTHANAPHHLPPAAAAPPLPATRHTTHPHHTDETPTEPAIPPVTPPTPAPRHPAAPPEPVSAPATDTRAAPDLPEHSPQPGSVSMPTPAATSETDMSADPVAPWPGHHPQPDGHLDLTRYHGLALTGPGATPAARGILTTLLSTLCAPTTDPTDEGPTPIVVLTAALADQLLDTPAATLDLPPEVQLAPSSADAIHALTPVMFHRARTTIDNPEIRHDPIVLFTDPTPDQHAALRALLATGSGHGLAAVLTTPWPTGHTCRITPDGVLATATGPHADELLHTQLPTSTPDELRQLLTDLATTAGEPPDPHHTLPDTTSPQVKAKTEPSSLSETPTRHSVTASDTGPSSVIKTDPAAVATGAIAAALSTTPIPASPPPAATAPELAPRCARVVVRCYGSLRIQVRAADDQPLRDVTAALSPKHQLLISALASRPDGVPTADLLEAGWPDTPYKTAQQRLSATLTTLRKQLRDAIANPHAPLAAHANGRYHLTTTPTATGETAHADDTDTGPAVWVDHWDFLDTATTARTHTGTTRTAAQQRMTDLYTGALLPELDTHWIESTRIATQRDAINAHAQLAEHHQHDHPEQAIALLQTALQHDPTNQATTTQLIRLHHHLGQPDAAHRAYATLAAHLADAGLPEPDPTTTQALTPHP